MLVWLGGHPRRGGLPQHPLAPDGNWSDRQARITSAELGARSVWPKRWRADTLASSGSQAKTQRGSQECGRKTRRRVLLSYKRKQNQPCGRGTRDTLHHLALPHCTLMGPLPVPALITVAGVAAVLLVVIVAKKCLCKTSSGDGDRGDIEMDGGMSTKIRHEVRSPFG